MTLNVILIRRSAVLRRIWSLFLVLVASSLVMTGTVHALETPGQISVECSGTVHTDGDADQTQGDSDKAVPHHHGTCHGPALNIPTADSLTSATRVAGLRPFPPSESPPTSHRLDPALRPPTA